jgi:heme/copper-type cytochrome/quinol oxidase subunit 2
MNEHWRFLLILAVILAIAALYDAYRKRKSPGPRPVKKLTRREVLWITIVAILLVLLGFPLGRLITPPQSSSGPVTISDH